MRPRTYLHTLWQSISTPQYYVEVLRTKVSFSLRFFSLSYILIVLVLTGIFFRRDLPMYFTRLDEAFAELHQHFPSDLEIRWADQRLSVTPDQAVAVHYPSSIAHDALPQTLAYILPKLERIEDISSQLPSSTFFVVSPTTLYASDSQGNWSDLPLATAFASVESFTITKDNLAGHIESWKVGGRNILRLFSFIYPLLTFIVLVSGRLLGLLFDCIWVYGFLHLIGKRLPYLKVYQVGLHVAVVAEVVRVFSLALFPNTQLPMFDLAFWAYMIVIFMSITQFIMPAQDQQK